MPRRNRAVSDDTSAVDTREIIPSSSPRSAYVFSRAFIAGVFAGPEVPFPVPHFSLALGANIGPWITLEGTVGYPFALIGTRAYLARGEVAPYLVGRFGTTIIGAGRFIVPGVGIDVSRGDGTYAFVEGGVIWDYADTTYDYSPPVVTTTIVTTHAWKLQAGHLSFGIGQRF